MKVTISRSQTIPTAPYSPVKIEGNIEFETTEEELKEKYLTYSEKLDIIMANETRKLLDEQSTVLTIGYEKYLNSLNNVNLESKL
jgi:uncharacterized membrane protein YgaE (UPF0421/DUF939 family)